MAVFPDGRLPGQGVIKDVLSVSVSKSDTECAKTHSACENVDVQCSQIGEIGSVDAIEADQSQG
jgi:hypothetical protein